ncbi:uncharacterized protein LOC117343364 [Pecten maximus]|uniref:uncharacterized protein LOC117343364 n=1 Tax=Pecten maximus TaxID=6579 RepID=UPI0014583612|nr:uncharacterized protein LOC117343364 [Pecten maximus]
MSYWDKVLFTYIVGACLTFVKTDVNTQPTLVYKWITLEFDWPNDTIKQQYIANEDYIPENNAINGIKVYNESVYLTIPRLKKGIPATLAVVINNGSDSPVLRPYPNWHMHRKDDCDALYLVQSMEIDPNTGYMWILDTGLVAVGPVDVAPLDRCPPKLVIYDINGDEEVHRYIFDQTKVGVGMFYLNDIVLDYGADGTARFAYISDTLGRKLVAYDQKLDKAYIFVHESMQPNPNYATVTISNSSTQVNPLGINGIAISSDFRYVYYCSVAGLSLYQISTSVLRDSFATDEDFSRSVRKVGDKVSQSDGIYYGKEHNLYFSTLGRNAVYKWPISQDMQTQGKDSSKVEMVTQTVVSKDTRMEWVDSLGMDEDGELWFTSNNLHTFFGNSTEDGSWNYYVWRMFVDDSSYLNITGLTVIAPTQGSGDLTSSMVCLLIGVATYVISTCMSCWCAYKRRFIVNLDLLIVHKVFDPRIFAKMTFFRMFSILCVLFSIQLCSSVDDYVIYRWQFLDYEWPDMETRSQFVANGSYIQENNQLGNIRAFNGSVYVTVPRLRKGVPSTLNVVVGQNDTDSPLLRPFPNWEMNQGATCDHFRFVNAFEIDPNTGWMWIVDTGYYPAVSVRPDGHVKCPAKLVIFDLKNNIVLHSHIFPPLVVGYGNFYLTDMVLDFTDNTVTHAYITDTYDWKLIVYDHNMNYSHSFVHPSMNPESGFSNITVHNKTEIIRDLGIRGIAMAPDFKFVYYTALAGLRLFRIPTSVLRDFKHDSVYFAFNVKKVGNKVSIGEGMYCSQKNSLFFSAPNIIYKWSLADTVDVRLPLPSNVTYASQSVVFKEGEMNWISSLTIDEDKNLWFTSRPLGFISKQNYSKWNYFVLRTDIGVKGYMDFSVEAKGLVQGAAIYQPTILTLLICCMLGMSLTNIQ